MSEIAVLSPLGINRVKALARARRLASLENAILGILNNRKPNSLLLQEAVVELVAQRHPLARVVTRQKPNAAVGAEQLDLYAGEVGAVITAIGD
jgi:hypothetical protein